MNLSTVKWTQWDKTQSRELLGLFICVCIALCTIVAHNIAQNRPDNFPHYPPDNHHCSDDVYLREGGKDQWTERKSYDSIKHILWWSVTAVGGKNATRLQGALKMTAVSVVCQFIHAWTTKIVTKFDLRPYLPVTCTHSIVCPDKLPMSTISYRSHDKLLHNFTVCL